MKKLSVAIFLIYFLFPQIAFAIYNPLSVPNNKYGIHVADTNDVSDTTLLVNSSGGEWGYVTMVMQDNDKNFDKWQGIFNTMRRLHLIPIVRIATHPNGDSWGVPPVDGAQDWASFLNSLNWPVTNRYVVLFNEPNHAKEWGNTVDPEGYASTLVAYSKALKAVSGDFFVLPAGLDASASSDGEAMDEFLYIRRMVAAQPNLFGAIDGWTSHSYPNPGFSGSPFAWGRGTLHTYEWELSLLSGLGNTKTLPVFITETGWVHSQGKTFNFGLLSSEAIGENLRLAASVWQDPRIVAVTPFVFSYQDMPFDHFSWRKLGESGYYAQYVSYQQIGKTAGKPKQHLVYNLSHPLFPPVLVAGSTYTLATTIKNEGSGILDPHDDYQLVIQSEQSQFETNPEGLPTLEPGDSGEITLHVKTPRITGTYATSVMLNHYDSQILLEKRTISIIPAPSVSVHMQLGWRSASEASGVTVLVYDGNKLLHKFTGLTVTNGDVRVDSLTDIVPGNSYRIVAVVPYYLPRQSEQILTSQTTQIAFKRFWPLDINNDGALTIADLFALLKLPPKTIFARLVGT